METNDIFHNILDDMPATSDATLEGDVGESSEIGDMTFCMGNYVTNFMKVM
jgi:hypothetical protein